MNAMISLYLQACIYLHPVTLQRAPTFIGEIILGNDGGVYMSTGTQSGQYSLRIWCKDYGIATGK